MKIEITGINDGFLLVLTGVKGSFPYRQVNKTLYALNIDDTLRLVKDFLERHF